MIYPKLIRKEQCKTPIDVIIYQEGVSKDGEPLSAAEFLNLKCNWQDKATTALSTEQKAVKLTGKAYFHEDFCPDIPAISGGEVVVFGVKRKIYSGRKNRNPDGSVNNVELEIE